MTTDAANRRLFFGLAVPTTVQPALLTARAACRLPGTWRPVATANWHLTLAFLGPVPERRLACIERAAAAIEGHGFDLCLDHLGHWPRPQVLWAAPSQTPAALAQLVDTLQTALRPCGYPREQRPYAPHLTLARKLRRVDALPELPAQCWRVTQFHLYQSLSGPSGVSYPVIGRWPLTG